MQIGPFFPSSLTAREGTGAVAAVDLRGAACGLPPAAEAPGAVQQITAGTSGPAWGWDFQEV